MARLAAIAIVVLSSIVAVVILTLQKDAPPDSLTAVISLGLGWLVGAGTASKD